MLNFKSTDNSLSYLKPNSSSNQTSILPLNNVWTGTNQLNTVFLKDFPIYLRSLGDLGTSIKYDASVDQAALFGYSGCSLGASFSNKRSLVVNINSIDMNLKTNFNNALPETTLVPTTANQLVNKAYVDSVVPPSQGFKQILFGIFKPIAGGGIPPTISVFFSKPFTSLPVVILTVVAAQNQYTSSAATIYDIQLDRFSYYFQWNTHPVTNYDVLTATINWIAIA